MEFVTLVETEVVAADITTVQQIESLSLQVLQSELVLVENVDGTETEILSETSTVVEQLDSIEVDVITDQVVDIQLLEMSAGPPGPAGPPGVSEDEMMYAKRVDFVTDDLLYRGEAVVGSAESASVWRVRRITIGTGGDVTEEWANGNANFDKTWDGRLGFTYS